MGLFLHRLLSFRTLSIVFGLCCILLSSCSRPNLPLLKLAVNHWPGYEFLFLAKEKGYFEKEGVRVQLVEFTSLPDVLEAYQSGDVDGMTCTMVETVLAAEQAQRQPQVILVADYSNGGDVILARPPIGHPGHLARRHVACESNHLGGYLLHRALNQHNLELEDVTIHNIDQAAMERAFRQGEVDALVTYPPVSTHLLRDTDATIIFSSSDIPREILDVVVADKTVINKNPETIRAIMRAWADAHDFLLAHPKKAHQIMGKRIGLSAEEFEHTLDDIQIVSPREQTPYLGPEGQVATVAEMTHQTLRQMGAVQHAIVVADLVVTDSLYAQR